MKRSLIAIACASALVLAVPLCLMAKNAGSGFLAETVTHSHDSSCVIHHYAQVDPTTEKSGVKEYWICCSDPTHTVSFTDPGVGNITDATHPTGFSVSSNDDRYIARLLTPEEKISSMLVNSKPTVSKLTMTYRYPSGKFYVELTYKGTLTVEYGDTIKASYVSEKEVLNDSLEGDFKKTVKNTYYAEGEDVGTLKSDGSVEWDSEAEASFVLPSLELDFDLFDSSSKTVTSTYFYGKVLSGQEAAIVNENVSSLDLSLRFSQDKLSTLKSNYVTEKGASVSLSCSYTYRSVTVNIPE